MKRFSKRERLENIRKMQEEIFDLCIIGGGINGAGVARDAASRGMRVALIEAKDFASGSSSRSSKLIHGGIRYLENLEFHLVFEALNERTRLFEMAPHLVHPLRFMVPLYENSRVGMFKMGLGMWLYDALALFQAPEMHERLNAKESLTRMPALEKNKLSGSYVYSDAYMDDDRLVHETLRSAHEMGAICANFAKAVGASFAANGKIDAVECEDQLDSKKFKIRAKHVVSCVGPWTDDLGPKLLKGWQNILRPTKGIHLTLQKSRLPLSSAVVMAAEKSDRIVFGIPRHEMVVIGTTDTDYRELPDGVVATADDVKYLLEVTHQYFPGAAITEKDIVATYAGVRPLVKDQSSSEGKTSREHVIIDDERGVTLVAGGKYTTYRLMSEQVVCHSLKFFSFDEKVRFSKNDTLKALNPYTNVDSFQQAMGMSALWAQESGRPEVITQKLAERYGMEAAEILHRYPMQYNYWQLEAAQAIDHTLCLNLVDFYARRVPLFLARPDHGMPQLESICEVFKEKLAWPEAELQRQKEALLQYMERELAWKSFL
ncbi:MAG TPA: glycerol-3-phosphate dehydrogenase/oxidase [Pseudobdellovibrionaceae bacterium]|jgi:glycerol-3-phosphate dehydrogenase